MNISAAMTRTREVKGRPVVDMREASFYLVLEAVFFFIIDRELFDQVSSLIAPIFSTGIILKYLLSKFIT